MRRRQFLSLLGGAVGWPLAARAQPSTSPVVGFLYSASGGPYAERLVAFRQGLAETGFIDGRNVTLEYRFAEGHYERLPALVSELVRHPVAVIAASGITAARAAKAATATIPIVFNTGGDPVRLGLVTSLNKPEGNLTGVVTLGKVLVAKQLELLQELVPKATSVAFLINPNNAVVQDEIGDARAAAGALGRICLSLQPAASAMSTPLSPRSCESARARCSCKPTHSWRACVANSWSWQHAMPLSRSRLTSTTPQQAAC